uniref:type II toxin-antitoxin system RelE family toxin n=1 Tax=Candidatus Electronema sp. TaxID=2698783 RepID=UPI00405757BA
MKHCTSSDFWEAYQKLPAAVQELADKNFDLLKRNPRHPSLYLKRIEELWSVRVGRQHRALGIDSPEGIQWIWIGSHAEYDRLTA